MLASSAIDRGFELQSDQIKDYAIGSLASPQSTQHYGDRAKIGCLGIMMMCPNGAKCLPADLCFSELVL